MYKILGADQKEYGPVSADQVRQWIAEGRLNAQSMVQPEGTEGWKPLSEFGEFSATLAGVAASAPAQTSATLAPLPSPAVRPARTNPMALTGLIMGILTLMLGCCCYGFPFNVLGIIFSSIGLSQINKNPEVERGKGLAIAGLALSIGGTILLIALIVIFGVVFNFDEIMRHIKK